MLTITQVPKGFFNINALHIKTYPSNIKFRRSWNRKPLYRLLEMWKLAPHSLQLQD